MQTIRLCAAGLALSASLGAYAQDPRGFQMGQAASVAQAERTIVIHQDTKWVNVTRGDAVRFLIGGAEFAWKFDGVGMQPFDLREIAPAGSLSRPVMVYLAQPPGRRNN